MPVSEDAEILDEHDTRIWRVIAYYVKKSRAKEDFSNVTTIGVDELLSRKDINEALPFFFKSLFYQII